MYCTTHDSSSERFTASINPTSRPLFRPDRITHAATAVQKLSLCWTRPIFLLFRPERGACAAAAVPVPRVAADAEEGCSPERRHGPSHRRPHNTHADERRAAAPSLAAATHLRLPNEELVRSTASPYRTGQVRSFMLISIGVSFGSILF